MGASKGLGRGVAAALAREGARVAVVSRSAERDRARRPPRIVSETGGEVRGYAADTDDVDALPALVGAGERPSSGRSRSSSPTRAGPRWASRCRFDRDQWEAAYRSLVLAPLALIKAVVPGMRRARLGPDREHHLARHQGADPGPDALEQPPARRGRDVQDARDASWPATASCSTASRRGGSPPTGSRAWRGASLEEIASAASSPTCPVGRLGHDRGVRRRGRVPVLGAGVLRLRRQPARRRRRRRAASRGS